MKLDYRRTILVGLAFMSICLFWQIYDSIIPLILKNTFDINDTLSGAVMALDNVLALFMLPLFGMFSDKTNTKIGRRMPYIIGGTAAAVILMVLIPYADNISSLPVFIAVLALVLICMSTYRSPAVALMPDVTPKPLRSKGNAVINLMGAVGGIISLGLVAFLVPKVDKPDYLPLFGVVAVIMLISVLILFFTTNEKKLSVKMIEESKELSIDDEIKEENKESVKLPPDKRKSLLLILASVFLWFMGYNAVTTAFSKYAQVYWNLEGGLFAYTLIVANVAAILSYIPVGFLASKIGRRKTILCGIILLTFAFGAAMFFESFSALILFFFALAGIAWASINVNSYPMVVEMSKGNDVGKYTGFYYTFSMAAQIVTPILSGAVLQYMGYKWLFPYGTLFVALSFVTMFFVKHGDSRPNTPKSKLEAFSGDD
ncbi:MAG: sodium-melibiose symporter [Clostridia bacterium]|nr:sodium-melibiose symporter [Clostridia bacterium]